jgi:hypothetical protein
MRGKTISAAEAALMLNETCQFWCLGQRNYIGSKSATNDFSSFNSFSVAAIFALLNSFKGTF